MRITGDLALLQRRVAIAVSRKKSPIKMYRNEVSI